LIDVADTEILPLACPSGLSLFVYSKGQLWLSGEWVELKSNAPGFDAFWHPYESGAVRNDIWLKFPLCNTNCPTLLIIDTPESSLAKESVI